MASASRGFTTGELMRRHKVSRSTLLAWTKAGKISPPTRVSNVGSRGSVNLYPHEVGEQIETLKGKEPLSEAEQAIEWAARGKKPFSVLNELAMSTGHVREYGVAHEAFGALVVSRAAAVSRSRTFLREVYDQVTRTEILSKVRATLEAGAAPVLLVGRDVVRVIPDFLVGQEMSQATDALLAVPLVQVMRELAAHEGKLPPKKPRYRPAARVVDDKAEEVRVNFVVREGEEGWRVLQETP